jgi:hypothetical protein
VAVKGEMACHKTYSSFFKPFSGHATLRLEGSKSTFNFFTTMIFNNNLIYCLMFVFFYLSISVLNQVILSFGFGLTLIEKFHLLKLTKEPLDYFQTIRGSDRQM